MWISAFCTAVLAYVVIGHAPPAAAQVDQQRAQEDFKEAQALCERDGGRLWGVSIYPWVSRCRDRVLQCLSPVGDPAARARRRTATDGGSRRLPAPVRGDDVTISGDGWTFRAAAGWVVREGARR